MTKKQPYIALSRISSKDGSEVWNRGSKIELDDETALLLLEKGRIMPMDEFAKLPQREGEPSVIVHEKEELTPKATPKAPKKKAEVTSGDTSSSK